MDRTLRFSFISFGFCIVAVLESLRRCWILNTNGNGGKGMDRLFGVRRACMFNIGYHAERKNY
jgi:hypothetical protein